MNTDDGARLFMQIAGLAAQTSEVEVRVFLNLFILALLILFNAAFAATEIAVITQNDSKVRMLADEGDKTCKRLVKYIDGPSHFLSTIQVGITFAGFLASALAADKFAQPLAQALDPEGRFPFLGVVTVIVITAILAYLSLVFGELVPKRIALKNPMGVLKYTLFLLIFVGKIMKPFVMFLTFSSNFVLRVIGINPNEHEKKVTEEEIRMMINVGRETGTIHEAEREMIENIFELNDTQVSEIMTHRTDLVSLSGQASFNEVIEVAVSEKFTRIPVYKDSIDNIIGILHIKDLLTIMTEGRENSFNLENIIREPLFVPETKTVDEVFREMQNEHAQIAIVIDEYGGTAGIITVEDLIEEIVGSIQDEYDEEPEEIIREDDTTVVVDGKAPLDEVADELDVKIPLDKDYDTVAGLFMDILGRIPDEGETPEVDFENLTLKVLEVNERRITRIRITVHPMPENEEDDSDETNGKNNNSGNRKDKNERDSEKHLEDIEHKKTKYLP